MKLLFIMNNKNLQAIKKIVNMQNKNNIKNLLYKSKINNYKEIEKKFYELNKINGYERKYHINNLVEKIVYEVNTLIVKNENNYNLIKQFENNLFKVIDKQNKQELDKEKFLINCNIISIMVVAFTFTVFYHS